MTMFEDRWSRLTRLGPADVLDAVANGWQSGALADINLGAFPVEEDDLGSAVGALSVLAHDIRADKARGMVSVASDPARTVLTRIVTEGAGAVVLDYEAPVDRTRRSALAVLVADELGDPLALVRGADGGRTLGAPANAVAREVYHAVRDAASRFALGHVVDGGAASLDPEAVEVLDASARWLADPLDQLNSPGRPRSRRDDRRPRAQTDTGDAWFAGGWSE